MAGLSIYSHKENFALAGTFSSKSVSNEDDFTHFFGKEGNMRIGAKEVLFGLFVLVCLAVLQEAVTAQEKEEPPKITKIVLYKHGVGYFERLGKVKGDATISLSFKTSQIKDLLTSLYAIDTKGTVVSIGYDSKDPIEKQLEGVLIRVPEANAMTQFLMQLKGAQVEVTIGTKTVRGYILGVEPVVEKKDQVTITNYKLVIMGEDGEIQPVNLFDVSGLKILDEMIQADLKRVLNIYLNSKYTDRKQVKISVKGQGERDVQIGYIIEAPIWKTSYRLILREKEKPQLQGWAIVENPTDENWEEVKLSLVAGNPISYVIDLYTPYYPRRPEIQVSSLIPGVPLVAGLLRGGGKEALSNQPFERAKKMQRQGAPGAEMAESAQEKEKWGAPDDKALGGLALAAPPLAELLAASFEAVAQGAATGELFSYDVKIPVTIPRNKAALVPIVREAVEGDKILYYNRSVSSSPMNAIYFKNITKFTLEAGPVTLFEESTSVGEGIFKKALKPGMTEIVPYAVETGCTVELLSAGSTATPAHSATLADGILTVRQFNILRTGYKITNQMGKPFTLYFEHPKSAGYELIKPEKAEEEAPGLYRFIIALEPNESKEFTVEEKMEVWSQVYVQTMRTEQIRFYLTEPYISQKTKAFLSDILEIMQQKAEVARNISNANSDIARLDEDQERCRKNLAVLRDNPKENEMRQDYLSRLTKADKGIEETRAALRLLRENERTIEETLIKKIREYKEEQKEK